MENSGTFIYESYRKYNFRRMFVLASLVFVYLEYIRKKYFIFVFYLVSSIVFKKIILITHEFLIKLYLINILYIYLIPP